MDRISTATKAANLFGAGKHGFKDGDLAGGIPPTDLVAEWFNGVQEEILTVIEAAGLAPSAVNRAQLLQALGMLCQPKDATLTALAAMVTAVDKLIYATGGDTFALTDLTAFARTLLAAGDAAAARTVLGISDSVKPGTVIYFAANTAPTGYLVANAAAVSRTTYATLFAAIGTTFGAGDGSTTFNLPELRGEFIRGWDNGRGVDSGRVFGSAQADDFKSHGHGVSTNGISIANSGSWSYRPAGSGTEVTSGTSGGTETRPRNIALLPCIKF